MAEYLAPGVYIEETSFRSNSIEGVATSTAGFVGPALYGPTTGQPMLITSVTQFQRVFGGLGDITYGTGPATNYLAHAVQAFFQNGGKRVYVARVHNGAGTAQQTAAVAGTRFRARFPGLAGEARVAMTFGRSGNLLSESGTTPRLMGVREGDLVEVSGALRDPNVATEALTAANLRWVNYLADGAIRLENGNPVDTLDPATLAGQVVQRVTMTVTATSSLGQQVEAGLSTHPDSPQYVGRVLRTADPVNGILPPANPANVVWFDDSTLTPGTTATQLLDALAATAAFTLSGGTDGSAVGTNQLVGSGTGNTATGLAALAEVEEISIVAAPGASAHDSANERQSARDALITHCERQGYRIAVLSGAQDLGTNAIQAVRAQHDSSHAALYYPWVVTRDPNGSNGDTLTLPPDGFIAGIYARSDVERGVHKAPANEVVRGALRFNVPVDHGTQETLNPQGINCLRFFEGRGYRVWGARTLSSNPEWKYVNVRRLFNYVEASIERSIQWAVFEPNNPELWTRVRLTVEFFLVDVWRTGALMGRKVEDAFFVRCDETTMTQSDLDNGRLVCLIGMAPTKPAEFVIFRIGQWTADASIL